uniref:palmitoyl-CoA hydrolase n=1 Tax=Poecilia reticulata TaxID=8081 RepID=A0A3P9N4K5_POERE
MRAPRAGWGPPAVLLLLLLLLASGSAHGYKPVIIVHGILDGPEQFKNLSGFINEVHPGTEVQIISLFNDCESMKPLLIQVPEFRKAIEKIMNARPEGVHVLCFSQGGLVCRAVLSTTPNHNVHTFISLSSPLAGQYGDTDYLKWLPGCVKKTAFLFCYNKVGQHFSFCDYWNGRRGSETLHDMFLFFCSSFIVTNVACCNKPFRPFGLFSVYVFIIWLLYFWSINTVHAVSLKAPVRKRTGALLPSGGGGTSAKWRQTFEMICFISAL